jgi:hypothetical protein
MSIPTVRVNRAPRAEIENCRVPTDVQRQQRLAQQVGSGVTPGSIEQRTRASICSVEPIDSAEFNTNAVRLVPDSTLSDDRWSQRLINTKAMTGRRHDHEQ